MAASDVMLSLVKEHIFFPLIIQRVLKLLVSMKCDFSQISSELCSRATLLLWGDFKEK